MVEGTKIRKGVKQIKLTKHNSFQISKVNFEKSILLVGLIAILAGRFFYVTYFSVLLLTVIHELGHALMAWIVGYYIKKIDIWTTLNGLISMTAGEERSPLNDSLVAWGGPLAQIIVLFSTIWFTNRYEVTTDIQYIIMFNFTHVNTLFLSISLLPINEYDGVRAWNLFPILFKKALA